VRVLKVSVVIRVSVPFSTAETGKMIVKNTRRMQAQKIKEKGNCIGFLSPLSPFLCI
jgi:hypothetical protein